MVEQNCITVSHGHGLPTEIMTRKEFEILFGIQYLPHLQCADYTLEKWVKKKCHTAYKKGKIAEYTRWLGHLHKKDLESGKVADCTIRWVNEKIGYGLFTNQLLPEAAFVGEYTGIVRRRNQPFANINDYCFMYPREWSNFRPLTIDSEKCGNHTRFINHSDTPNLEALSVLFEGYFHIIFRTTEVVPAGSELTYDYGALYWKRRKKILQ